MKLQAIAAITIILSGCTVLPPKELKLYTGEDLPLSKVSSIAVDGNVKGVAVSAVDGKSVPSAIDGIPMPNWKGAHVMPGKHTLAVAGNFVTGGGFTSWVSQTITVEVEAGHSYIPVLKKNEDTGEFIFGLFDAGPNYNQSCLIGTYPDHTKEREKASGCM